MRCFVTGASGFLGANLVHELVAQGHQVRAMFRTGSDTRGLCGVPFERVDGDVTDKSDVLADKMRGCEWCFHSAAVYALWMPSYAPMFQTNVLGTQKVIRAASKAGCHRIVYTSTASVLGHARRNDQGGMTWADENTPVAEPQLSTPYLLSKWQAEVAARELAREGAPVVIVSPTVPIGARDVKPTPTGRLLVDFLNRRLPGTIATGKNFVPVRDVVIGHILAAERGRVGERYILGSAEGNWTLRHAVEVLSELTGLPSPRLEWPHSAAYLFAVTNELFSKVTRRHPKAPVAGVLAARHRHWVQPAKAIQELGFPQTSVVSAFAEAIQWFRQNGYVRT